MMETEHNQILHFENIDKRQVGLHSPNMEREGLVHCLNFLISNGVHIKEVVTDSSTSVAKTIGTIFFIAYHFYSLWHITATDYPAIHHSRDIWHKAKKLRKALCEVCVLCIRTYTNNLLCTVHVGFEIAGNGEDWSLVRQHSKPLLV